MSLTDKIIRQLDALPPEKQSEVLDFIEFLQQRNRSYPAAKETSLRRHAAFGSWKHRNINAVQYQQDLRAEWGE